MSKLGLTKNEVKEILWQGFLKWIEHQTCPVDPKTNEVLYYVHDVEKFANLRRPIYD